MTLRVRVKSYNPTIAWSGVNRGYLKLRIQAVLGKVEDCGWTASQRVLISYVMSLPSGRVISRTHSSKPGNASTSGFPRENALFSRG